MSCEQLAKRIKGLRHQIELMQDQLDELEKKPKTPELIDEIERLENDINDTKKEVIQTNNQYKQNCQ